MKPLGLALIFLALLPAGGAAVVQDRTAAIIEGAVYDPHEAVVIGVSISIENTRTGELTNLRTDEGGRYNASVPEGRYRVTMHPHPGYPAGYEHSSFLISIGERATINFRPKPLAISDSIKEGKWVERYEGSVPSATTHFIQQPTGAFRDLRVQWDQLITRGRTFEYKWVTASFDRMTLHADRVVFDSQKSQLVADGNVFFDDSVRGRTVKRVAIDLLTGMASTAETPAKP